MEQNNTIDYFGYALTGIGEYSDYELQFLMQQARKEFDRRVRVRDLVEEINSKLAELENILANEQLDVTSDATGEILIEDKELRATDAWAPNGKRGLFRLSV